MMHIATNQPGDILKFKLTHYPIMALHGVLNKAMLFHEFIATAPQTLRHRWWRTGWDDAGVSSRPRWCGHPRPGKTRWFPARFSGRHDSSIDSGIDTRARFTR